MSKAILILDEMPETCVDCDLMAGGEDIGFWCVISGRVVEDADGKFDDCPLKVLPERKHIKDENIYKGEDGWSEIVSFDSGWNHCLQEILRTEG